MRTRNIKKNFWLNREEATMLKKKAKKVGMNESTLIRNLILGFEPREKPDERFYESLRPLYSISNNLNQLTKKANSLGFIDEVAYKKLYNEISKITIDIKKKYLLPEMEKEK